MSWESSVVQSMNVIRILRPWNRSKWIQFFIKLQKIVILFRYGFIVRYCFNFKTIQHRKWRLNVNVSPTTKFSSNLMQGYRKLCECSTRNIFIVAAEIRIAYSVLKMFNAEIVHYATRVHEKCKWHLSFSSIPLHCSMTKGNSKWAFLWIDISFSINKWANPALQMLKCADQRCHARSSAFFYFSNSPPP